MTDVPALVLNGRGKRFSADKPTIALYIGRSKNKNIVVYDVQTVPSPEHGGVKLHPTMAVDAHWLDLDPVYQSKNRAKGKQDDRDELNFIDKWQAYGVKVENVTAHKADLQFVALPKKTTTLHLEKCGDGSFVPLVKCQINLVDNAILERIWVEVTENWLGVPTVHHVDLFGVKPNGEPVTERVKP